MRWPDRRAVASSRSGSRSPVRLSPFAPKPSPRPASRRRCSSTGRCSSRCSPRGSPRAPRAWRNSSCRPRRAARSSAGRWPTGSFRSTCRARSASAAIPATPTSSRRLPAPARWSSAATNTPPIRSARGGSRSWSKRSWAPCRRVPSRMSNTTSSTTSPRSCRFVATTRSTSAAARRTPREANTGRSNRSHSPPISPSTSWTAATRRKSRAPMWATVSTCGSSTRPSTPPTRRTPSR